MICIVALPFLIIARTICFYNGNNMQLIHLLNTANTLFQFTRQTFIRLTLVVFIKALFTPVVSPIAFLKYNNSLYVYREEKTLI